MPTHSAPVDQSNTSLAPLVIVGVLPPIEGGEDNLLPKDAWLSPLRVEFELWSDHSTRPGAFDRVQLIWDGDEANPVDEKQFDGPFTEEDLAELWLQVPVSRLSEGVHTISYMVWSWNQSPIPRVSDPVNVTIDKSPPTLGSADSRLSIPGAVLPPQQLTAYYLERNEDRLRVVVPVFETPAPGDHIVWYWGERPGDLNEGGFLDLDEHNYTLPMQIFIPGELIRRRGDGWRYVSYRVWDRAGNPSPYSDYVELDVAATPIPRTLPWPTIENASGVSEQQILDPLQASSGVVVEIPHDAVIYPPERAWVQWGEPGLVGAHRVDQPISPEQRRYQIPMRPVAAHIGKTLWVRYYVIDEDDNEIPSVPRKLQVQTLPVNRLPTVQCNGLSGGNLSYSSVASTGAILRLATWPLMTTDHWIMITMTGIGSSGRDSVFYAINKRAVTGQEVIGGIGQTNQVRVSKEFLNTLRRNQSLTGKVYVSFDGGQTWPPLVAPNFPLLQLTLTD